MIQMQVLILHVNILKILYYFLVVALKDNKHLNYFKLLKERFYIKIDHYPKSLEQLNLKTN